MIASTVTRPPLWVGAAALVNGSGRVLMQRRRSGGAHPGLWEFPGGKLEEGESPEAATVRELAEELGVGIDPADLTAAGFASSASESGRPVVILLFLCRRWQGEPQALEAEEWDWVAPSALATLAMPPLDYPLAEGLCRILQQGAN